MRIEDHAVRTQSIKIRRLHPRRAIAPHRAHRLVIGHQENNIRPLVLGRNQKRGYQSYEK